MKNLKIFRNKPLRGFTLIEMMIVMIIAVILAGIAVPYFWGGYASTELKGSARRITSILRTAKSYAEAQNKVYDVFIWITAGHDLDIDIYEDFAINAWSGKVGKTEKIRLGLAFSVTSSILQDVNVGWAYRMAFNPDGTANDIDNDDPSEEIITIDNTKKKKKLEIRILEDTGRVKISDLISY